MVSLLSSLALNNSGFRFDGDKMFKSQQTDRVIKHIKTEYGVEPEFLWPEKYPSYCVFRHGDNRKWFALVATIAARSLGIEGARLGDDNVEIINLKFDKNQTYDFAETSDHIFPAYHMNKNNWITVVLDGGLSDEMVFELISKSYLLTDK